MEYLKGMANASESYELGPPGGASASNLSPSEPEYAGFGVRAVAHVIDWVVEFCVLLVAQMVAFVVLAMMAQLQAGPADWAERTNKMSATGLAVGVVGLVVYYTLAEGLGGATIGKALFGLRVRRVDHSPCGLGAAFLRRLAIFVDGLFFGLVAYQAMMSSVTQQRVGDKWAGTVVVKASSLDRREHPLPSIVFGILVSLVVTGAVGLIGTFVKVL